MDFKAVSLYYFFHLYANSIQVLLAYLPPDCRNECIIGVSKDFSPFLL